MPQEPGSYNFEMEDFKLIASDKRSISIEQGN